MAWLDEYERKARLVPGLIALLPVAIAIFALGIRENPVIAGALGVLSMFGLPVLLASVVRHRGLEVQAQLWRQWGGSPTVQSLRHVSNVATATQRAQWRHAAEEATGAKLPDESTELAEPEQSDAEYGATTARLTELTRSQELFQLVFEENKNYGFERNLYAMRAPGVFIATFMTLLLAVFIVAAHSQWVDRQLVDLYVGAALTILTGAMWWKIPSGTRVCVTGFRYATRLLDSASRIGKV